MEPLPYYLVLLTDMGENTYIKAITQAPDEYVAKSYPEAENTAWYGDDSTIADYLLPSGVRLFIRPVQDIIFRGGSPILTEQQAAQLKEV